MFILVALFLARSTGCNGSDPSNTMSQSEQSSPRSSSQTGRALDVPYVPTPKRVVDKMLDIAQVGSTDMVYDLGCGDGRLIITAAKEKGARGVGIDLNPTRIIESNENAARAKVKDRVTFIQQDLFETDFSEATVLTLYLLPEVNLMLRPRILTELKPGSRVVSHDFDMKEWEPDDTAVIGSSHIYYWVVPANFSGIWYLTVGSEKGSSRYSIIIEQSFQEIEGLALSGSSQKLLKTGKVKGEILEFTVEQPIDGKVVPEKFEGRMVGNTIQGTIKRGGKNEVSSVWTAERNPATARPIDGSKREQEPVRQSA
jgi:SAM-dependent methyltransferase